MGIRSRFRECRGGSHLVSFGIDGWFTSSQLNPNNSIIAQTLATSDPPQEGLTVGLDLDPYSLDITQPAGSIHWGAVPPGSWRGDWSVPRSNFGIRCGG
jgi:hypothetical protein